MVLSLSLDHCNRKFDVKAWEAQLTCETIVVVVIAGQNKILNNKFGIG